MSLVVGCPSQAVGCTSLAVDLASLAVGYRDPVVVVVHVCRRDSTGRWGFVQDGCCDCEQASCGEGNIRVYRLWNFLKKPKNDITISEP